ncbi:MAG: ABC transporter ATP-binding protein/permease, partial [Acholeplasmataceae bacterium]|nr:ABC transporter ATP-binding protein/permease [Acholeplasmataceae bacterium]
KTYRPKKGVPVVALDNVNLKIGDTGLVFILGKSGSGKSTLLNLLGGLDKYDDGDIIIKGKSTKDFTQSDFDSYRNTYVGFIFQEYNILNEFTVGANIALAIELQGRKASNEEVNKILATLDLVGYGNRRPNELSGGQKQRIAIARALVKNPDIILADEPTGALDSKTGIQIFEILKKLSKEKLVLVVSHDREFAEEYGDRVIELADGKIISDITKKTITNGDNDTSNIQYVEKEGVVVRDGYKLTSKDLEMINHYLEQHKNLNIVSKNDEEFRTRSVFVETMEDSNLKTYGSEFSMIKSKLPYKMAFKMGASGLKHKKFRLFFTILLSLVAFTLFGVTDSLAAYNKVDATVNSIIDGEIESAALTKKKTVTRDDYDQDYPLTLTDDDITKLNNGIGNELGLEFKPIYSAGVGYGDVAFRIGDNYSTSNIGGYNMFYLDAIAGLAEFTKEELEDLGFTIYGEMPAADDEIAVTDYIFQHFKAKGYGDYEKGIDIKAESFTNYNQLIGKNIYLRNSNMPDKLTFKVTAIIDTHLDSSRYDVLKDPDESFLNYYLGEEFRTVVQYGYHGLGFVNSGLIEKLLNLNVGLGLLIRNNAYIYYNTTSGNLSVYPEYVDKLSALNSNEYVFFDQNKTSLDKDEILVDLSVIFWYFQDDITVGEYTGNLDYHFYRVVEQIIYDYAANNYAEAEANNFYIDNLGPDGNNISVEDKIYLYYQYIYNQYNDNAYGEKNRIDLESEALIPLKPILQQLEEIPLKREYHNYIEYTSDSGSSKIVGVYSKGALSSPNYVIVDDEFYQELDSLGKQGPYNFALAKMPSERSKIQRLVEFNYTLEDSFSYPLKNSATPMLDSANSLVEDVAQVFLYIGLGFAVFSALMLSNYIATSVSVKKREIGILRAIGARSNDVFRIFVNESLIIALINFLLASVTTFIAVRYVNSSLRSGVGLMVTIFNFSIRQVGLLLLISVFVALVASFLPVNRIARKKPVDAISNR